MPVYFGWCGRPAGNCLASACRFGVHVRTRGLFLAAAVGVALLAYPALTQPVLRPAADPVLVRPWRFGTIRPAVHRPWSYETGLARKVGVNTVPVPVIVPEYSDLARYIDAWTHDLLRGRSKPHAMTSLQCAQWAFLVRNGYAGLDTIEHCLVRAHYTPQQHLDVFAGKMAGITLVAGFATVTYAGTAYYVDPSGNDAANGLTTGTAKRTLTAAMFSVGNNSNDAILLKRGATHVTETVAEGRHAGLAPLTPITVMDYGSAADARPVLPWRAEIGSTGDCSIVDVNAALYANYAFFNIDFYGADYTGSFNGRPMALRYEGDGDGGFWVENCRFRNLVFGIATGSGGFGSDPDHFMPDVVIRRNQFNDLYRTGVGGAAGSDSDWYGGIGIFITGTTGALIEENIFEYTGWKINAPANTNPGQAIYYSQDNLGDATIRRNIFSRGGGQAIMARSGLTLCSDNLIIGHALGINAWHYETEIDSNCIFYGCNSSASILLGIGIAFAQCDGMTITNNIVAYNAAAVQTDSSAINANFDGGSPTPSGDNIATIQGNWVEDWGCGVNWFMAPTNFDSITVSGNTFVDRTGGPLWRVLAVAGWASGGATVVFSGNHYYSTAIAANWGEIDNGNAHQTLAAYVAQTGETGQSITNPSGSVATPEEYLGAIGETATLANLRTLLRAQENGAWDDRLNATQMNDYFRSSVGISTLAVPFLVSATINPTATQIVLVWSENVYENNGINDSPLKVAGSTVDLLSSPETGANTTTLPCNLQTGGVIQSGQTVTLDMIAGAIAASEDDSLNEEIVAFAVTNNSAIGGNPRITRRRGRRRGRMPV